MRLIKKLLFIIFCLPLMLIIGIPGDGGAAEGGTENNEGADGAKENQFGEGATENNDKSKDGKEKDTGQEKKFTQADFDKEIAKQLAKAQKKQEKESTAKNEDGSAKAQLDDKSAEKISAANKRVLAAEAKVVCSTLGIKPDRIAHAIKLAELDKIEVDDDGEYDPEDVKAALEKVLKDLPELKAVPADENKGSGFHIGADGDSSKKQNTNATANNQQNQKRWNKFRI